MQKVLKRMFFLVFSCFFYAFTADYALANVSTLSNLGQGVLFDLLFNLGGALFGGIAQLCFSLNNKNTFVTDAKSHGLRNMVLSLFIGFIAFILTEQGGFFEVQNSLKQLAIVSISGAFSGESMEILRNWYQKKIKKVSENV